MGGKGSARERVIVLMSERVKEAIRVSSMIMYVGICIKRKFWSVISVYATEMERSEEERDSF